MITFKLTQDQASFLLEALNKAMDWESDSEYYEAYNDLRILVRNVAVPA